MAQRNRRQLYSPGYDYRPTTIPGVYAFPEAAPTKKQPKLIVSPPKKRRKAPDPMLNYVEGMEWWKALSIRPAAGLKGVIGLFINQEVASLLIDCTGGMKDLGGEFYHPTWRYEKENANTHKDEKHRGGMLWPIAIQIEGLYTSSGDVDPWIDICLIEAGIWIQESWQPENETNE